MGQVTKQPLSFLGAELWDWRETAVLRMKRFTFYLDKRIENMIICLETAFCEVIASAEGAVLYFFAQK